MFFFKKTWELKKESFKTFQNISSIPNKFKLGSHNLPLSFSFTQEIENELSQSD